MADTFDIGSFLDIPGPTAGLDVPFGEGFVDSGRFDTSGGGGFWDWLPSSQQFGAAAKDLKAGLGDITKLGGDQQQQRQQFGQGPSAVRGQAPVSITDLLDELMKRRAAYAQLGLQQGPFQPRAPGGGLLGLAT